MKKFYLLLGVAAITASGYAASHDGRRDLMGNIQNFKESAKEATSVERAEVISISNETVHPLQTQSPSKIASVDKKSVLLYEDFNNVPDGNTETIGDLGERYLDYIASHNSEPGRYINNDYTPGSGTWEGDYAFAGKGGTVVLQTTNSRYSGFINTPLGDYSGDITVTVRCRWARTLWAADNDLGYNTTPASSLKLAVFKKGYDSLERAVTDMPWSYLDSGDIYEQEGWQEVTFKFHNDSANAQGYIMLGTEYAIEIDWIKITDDNTFLATPVVNDITNFTNDGFTINWDPVRRSSNYYIDLWKTVYTADAGIDELCDFEEELMPEWLIGPDVEYAKGQGMKGSNAVMVTYDGINGGIATSDKGIKLDSFATKFMFMMDMDNIDKENPLTLCIDVYGDNGWEPFGSMVCDGRRIGPGYYYDLKIDDSYFKGLYSAVRVYALGTNEYNKLFIDDLALYAARPFVLERMGDVYDTTNDDYPYNAYDCTGQKPGSKPGDTSYTFSGLDPETEYWYRVRSHNMFDFTTGEKIHAFGVAAPILLPAANINEKSYTAQWIDAPKAQKYIVTNYAGVEVTEDNPQFILLEETFSKCTGETKRIDNDTECDLDEYTDLKGWKGVGNTVGENFIGIADRGYITTPPMMVNPDRGSVWVYLDVNGMYPDNLYINTLIGNKGRFVPFDEDGKVNGWLEIPAIEGQQIRLYSYYGVGLTLNGFDVMQEVKQGDIIRKFDSCVEVPAGEQAYTFSNLNGDLFAYSVVANFTLEHESTNSISDKFVTVNISNNDSNITSKIDSLNSTITELERYSIDGSKVNNGYKGVVITKMSDGSIVKKIVK